MAGTIKIDTIQSELTTPTVFKNSNGTEIGQLTKAWLNYNASSLTINRSFNISSVTSNSTGDKTITLLNAFSDAYFSVTGSNIGDTQASYACFICAANQQALTSTTARHRVNNYSGSLYDATTVSICFNR